MDLAIDVTEILEDFPPGNDRIHTFPTERESRVESYSKLLAGRGSKHDVDQDTLLGQRIWDSSQEGVSKNDTH